MEKVEYWYNTKTSQVEVGKQSLSIDRLGPFETFEEAQNALSKLEERARKIRQEDENWN